MTTMTDLFCGAGGSSTGAEMVPGIEVVMAANHSIAKGISRQRQDEARRRDLLGLLEAGKPLSDDAAICN